MNCSAFLDSVPGFTSIQSALNSHLWFSHALCIFPALFPCAPNNLNSWGLLFFYILFTFIFFCVCAYMLIHVCMSILGIFYSPWYFWSRVSHLTRRSVIQPNKLARAPQEPCCLCSLVLRPQMCAAVPSFSTWVLGVGLRFLCLHRTDWAAFPAHG